MKTWKLAPINGVRGSVSYEAYRGRLFVSIAHNGDKWSIEIPLGEMSYRIGLSGATLDAARARWAAVNAPKPEWKQRNAAARAKERARDVKRKRASVRMLADAKALDEAIRDVPACDLVPLVVNRGGIMTPEDKLEGLERERDQLANACAALQARVKELEVELDETHEGWATEALALQAERDAEKKLREEAANSAAATMLLLKSARAQLDLCDCEALDARLAVVKALHVPREEHAVRMGHPLGWCRECNRRLPCPTVRAVEGKP